MKRILNRLCGLLLSLILVQSLLQAQTNVSGDVFGTWTKANSPYVVTADITIPENQQLTIEPGVVVQFYWSTDLVVHGSIHAIGTETDSIKFMMSSNGMWSGIDVKETTFDVEFAYCIIQNASRAFEIDHAMLNIRNSHIQKCYDKSGAGIYTSQSTIKIVDCLFHNITSDYGAGVYNNSSKVYILNSVFYNNKSRYNSNHQSRVFQLSGGIIYMNNSVVQWDKTNEKSKILDSNYSGKLLASNCIFANSIVPVTGAIELNYCLTDEQYPGVGNIAGDPMFSNPAGFDFTLDPSSPCIDAGDPNPYFNDHDGTRNNIGCLGGSRIWINADRLDFGALNFGKSRVKQFIINNFRTESLNFDQISVNDPNNFSLSPENSMELDPFETDTLNITFTPNTDIPSDLSSTITFVSDGFYSTENPELKLIGYKGYSGEIEGTWSAAQSPYAISGDLTVAAEKSLTIEPGVEIKFDGHYKLYVEGTLLARGNTADSIKFTRYYDTSDSLWYGLYFKNAQPSMLEYCVLEYAGRKSSYGDDRDGRAITSYYTDLSIRHSNISNNRAHWSGGGLYIDGGQLKISGSSFKNNLSWDGAGGAFYIYKSDMVSIHTCEFIHNSADYSGGAAQVRNCHLFIANSVFINNRTDNDEGTALCFSSGDAYVDNCIIDARDLESWNNETTLSGQWGNVIVNNSILLGCVIAKGIYNYCNIEGGWEGRGNIDTDPLFVDADHGDYHLQPDSPCIDTGHPSAFYGDINGTRNDMGIYGGSGLAISGDHLDFGFTSVGKNESLDWLIYNFREDAMTLDSWEFSDEDNFSTPSEAPLTIEPSTPDTLKIDFHPVTSGDLNATLTISSSELTYGQSANIYLNGVGGVYKGEVSGRWTKENSPYIIGDYITVPENEELIIEPGVTVYIDTTYGNSRIKVYVYGDLIANGTETDSILFVPSPGQARKGIWSGIEFNPRDEGYFDRRFEMSYCRVSHATNALDLNSENPIITHSTFSHNSMNGIKWNGNYEFNNAENGWIIHNHIHHNDNYGIYCRAHCGTNDGYSKPHIRSNLIEQNHDGGIYLHSDGGSTSSVNLFSRNNDAMLSARVYGNAIRYNGGYGIHCHADGTYSTISGSIKHYSHAQLEPVIEYNEIVGNANGLRMESRLFEEYTLSNSDVTLNNNVFYGNDGDQMHVSDSLSNVTALNNIFWNYSGNSIFLENEPYLKAQYNCFQTAVEDTGNITDDPQFVNALNNYFSLQYTSPCINAGAPFTAKDPDNTRTDIGAYYYHQSISNFSLTSPGNDTTIANQTPVFRWNPALTSGGDPLTYTIYYSHDKSFTEPETRMITGLTETFHTIEDSLEDREDYYWKVLASNLWSMERWCDETWHVTINSDTIPPYFTAELPELVYDEDDSLTMVVSDWYGYVADEKCADSTLVFTVESGDHVKAIMQIDQVLFSSPVNWFGVDTVSVTVTDLSQLSASSHIIVTVNSINDAPKIGDVPTSIQFDNDSEYVLDVASHVEDVDTPDSLLTYRFACSNDSIYCNTNSQAPGVVTLTAHEEFTGKAVLYVHVFDDYADSAQVTIDIQVESVTAVAVIGDDIPKTFKLVQNYPNPFNPLTAIPFSLPRDSHVSITIYNINGEKICEIINGKQKMGHHMVTWDAHRHPSGVYFIRFDAGNVHQIRKCLLIK